MISRHTGFDERNGKVGRSGDAGKRDKADRARRRVAALLCIFMLSLCFPATSAAADTGKAFSCLALGDSISTGYGLSQPESEGFVACLEESWGGQWYNAARSGATSTQLRKQVTEGTLDSRIREADIITITIGGNDVMEVFYRLIADRYGERYPDSAPLSAEDVPGILADLNNSRNLQLLLIAGQMIAGGYDSVSGDFQQADSQVQKNLSDTMAYIRKRNHRAVIVVATQYNPYKGIELSFFSAIPVGRFMDSGVRELNRSLEEGAAASGYVMADIYGAFDQVMPEEELCNASADPLNLDFHPNSSGHRKIAQVFEDTFRELERQGRLSSRLAIRRSTVIGSMAGNLAASVARLAM